MTASRIAGRVLVSLLVFALPATAVGQRALRVDWANGRLSVVADNAPLVDVLALLAHKTGLEVSGLDAASSRGVSVSFSHLSLREGLQRVLAVVGQDYVLIEEASPDQTARPMIVALAGRDHRRPPHPAMTVLGPESPAAPEVEPEKPSRPDDDGGGRRPASLAARDPAIRRWAVSRLGERGDAETFARLQEGLQDRDAGVREAALGGLAQFGTAAIESLKNLVRNEPVSEVRVAAIQLLGQVGREETAHALHRLLDDPDLQVRIAAVEASGYADSAIGRETLARAARDKAPEVRMAALRTLAFYARDDAGKAIVQQGLLDSNENVRALAMGLLEVLPD